MTILPNINFSFTLKTRDIKSIQQFFIENWPDIDFSFKIATSAGWVDMELL